MMSPTNVKARNFIIFSTGISAIGLIVALSARLSRISLLMTAALFIVHLPILWTAIDRARFKKIWLKQVNQPGSAPIGFLLCTSIVSIGLGSLAWIFLFPPGSQVRDQLIQLTPVIGWGIANAAYLLAALGAELNAGEKKLSGLLIGAVLLSVIGHLFFFWLSARIFSFTIDDAYITFRYSKNLAAGFGPTYNPDQLPVEGYTTLAWMLLMTLPHFMGINVATFSKIIGVLATSGTFTMSALLTFTLTRSYSIKTRIFFGIFASFLTAMLPITVIHAVSGMETALFTLLISLMVYMVTVGIMDQSGLLFWSPLIGLLIGMTRPEGNAIAVLLLVCGWYFSSAERRKHLLWFSTGVYFLPGIIYFLWRYTYYSLLFPLPFYMKVLHGGGLFGGAGDVGTYLIYVLPTLGLLVSSALLFFQKEYLPTLIPVVFLVLFYLFPVHAMGFDWRFIFPATPFITVLAAGGGIIWFGVYHKKTGGFKSGGYIIIIALLLTGMGHLQGLDSSIKDKNFYGAGISSYKAFGTLLSDYNNQHEYTLAIGDAGTVPYYSDWQVVDLFGLNSREIAFGSTPTYSLIFEKQPADLILLAVGSNPKRISDEHAGSQNLFHEAVQRGMAHIGTIAFSRNHFIWVIGYPDTDLAKIVQKNYPVDFSN